MEANSNKGKFPWNYETKLSSKHLQLRPQIIFQKCSTMLYWMRLVLRNDLIFERICCLQWPCKEGNHFTLALSSFWPQEATRNFCHCFGHLICRQVHQKRWTVHSTTSFTQWRSVVEAAASTNIFHPASILFVKCPIWHNMLFVSQWGLRK